MIGAFCAAVEDDEELDVSNVDGTGVRYEIFCSSEKQLSAVVVDVKW